MSVETSTELLWPPAAGPDDLAAIESIPLAARGLPESSYAALTRAAELWPDRTAISVLPDAERWEQPVTRSFSEFSADVHRVANAFATLGVKRGDAVAVLALNCLELLNVVLATEAIGVYAPINPALGYEQASELVRLSGADVIVAPGPELDGEAWIRGREIAEATGATALIALRPTAPTGDAPALEPLGAATVAYLEELVDGASSEVLPVEPPSAGDIASYLHTGGTTGTPKLAGRTHENELSNAWMIACNDKMAGDRTGLAALPLFHTNALIVTVLAPLLRGQHVLWAGPLGYRDLPLYGHFWKIVERYSIAAMSGVPTVYAVLSQVPIDADISSLEFPIVGAAPLPPAVAEGWLAHTGSPLLEGYGLTEATCASARNWSDHPRPGTVGQRLPYTEIAAFEIDDESGEWRFLPVGEVGLIAVRGPNVFAGYLVAGDAGRALSDEGKIHDGWLDTGDRGSVDEEGFLKLAGREKDLIIRGGHNIDPAPIEDVILEHADVTAAAAVGKPDRHAGEVPVVFVSLVAGSGASAEDLVDWAAQRVAEKAVAPKVVYLVDEIPLTVVGKPYKPELRRRAAETAAREELAAAGLDVEVRAEMVDGAVELVVAPLDQESAIRDVLDAFVWQWRFE